MNYKKIIFALCALLSLSTFGMQTAFASAPDLTNLDVYLPEENKQEELAALNALASLLCSLNKLANTTIESLKIRDAEKAKLRDIIEALLVYYTTDEEFKKSNGFKRFEEVKEAVDKNKHHNLMFADPKGHRMFAVTERGIELVENNRPLFTEEFNEHNIRQAERLCKNSSNSADLEVKALGKFIEKKLVFEKLDENALAQRDQVSKFMLRTAIFMAGKNWNKKRIDFALESLRKLGSIIQDEHSKSEIKEAYEATITFINRFYCEVLKLLKGKVSASPNRRASVNFLKILDLENPERKPLPDSLPVSDYFEQLNISKNEQEKTSSNSDTNKEDSTKIHRSKKKKNNKKKPKAKRNPKNSIKTTTIEDSSEELLNAKSEDTIDDTINELGELTDLDNLEILKKTENKTDQKSKFIPNLESKSGSKPEESKEKDIEHDDIIQGLIDKLLKRAEKSENSNKNSDSSGSTSTPQDVAPKEINLKDLKLINLRKNPFNEYAEGKIIKENAKSIIIDDPSNYMTIRLGIDENNANSASMPKSFAENIKIWFSMSSPKALEVRGYLDPRDEVRFCRTIEDSNTAIRIHRFSKLVDKYIPKLAIKDTIYNPVSDETLERLYIPGRVTYKDTGNSYKCYFVYLLDKEGKCFHRNIEFTLKEVSKIV